MTVIIMDKVIMFCPFSIVMVQKRHALNIRVVLELLRFVILNVDKHLVRFTTR